MLVLTSADNQDDKVSYTDEAPVSVSGDTLNRRYGSTEIETNGSHTSTKFSATTTTNFAPIREAKRALGTSSYGRKKHRGLGKSDVHSTEGAESHLSPPIYTEEQMQDLLREMRQLEADNDRREAALEDEKRRVNFARIERDTLVEQMKTEKNQYEEEVRRLTEQHAEQAQSWGLLVKERENQMETQKEQYQGQIKRLKEQQAQARETLVQEHAQQMAAQENESRKESVILQEKLVAQRQDWEENMPCGGKCLKEIETLKDKLDELHASHIKSVNSVGTGLDWISDKTFEDRLRCIHDEACPYRVALIPHLSSSLSR